MERNVLIALLSILAALGNAWLISRRRYRRLSRLPTGVAPGAPTATEGRMPPLPAPSQYNDELSHLGVGIRQMRAQIEERDNQIRKLRDDLDLQVKLRTADLQAQIIPLTSGHTGLVAANGCDAVVISDAQEFDLVLADEQMPEMGGFEANRAIRKTEVGSLERIPIVAMTAHAVKGDREQCLAVGMDGYIAKPIRPPDFAAEIERFTRPTATSAQSPPSPCGDDCIDWQTAWANLEGDHSLLSELALLFLEDLPTQMEAIHRAVENKLGHDLERFAHRLKGSVGNFAANHAFKAALELERIARRGDFDHVQPAVEVLEREMQRLECALKEWANNPGQNGLAGPPLASSPPTTAASNAGLDSSCG